MVRKIEVFASTHVFGDIMIIITMIIIFGYATASLGRDGVRMEAINPIDNLWFDAIGFSVYSYEGIGVILPIREVTACKDDYFKLLCITVCSIAALYIIFGEYCMLAWGSTEDFD